MTSYNMDLKKLFLELTMKCNLNCKTCFRHNWDMPLVDMSKELACKIGKDLEAFPEVNEIVFGGIGEPTLHPDFSHIVQLFNKYSLGLTTNAYYWSEETLDTIVRYFDRIVVSVDGLEKTFREFRGFDLGILEKNLLRLAEKKKELNRSRPLIQAQLVLSASNVEEVHSLIPRLHRMGVMKLIISNLLPQDSESRDQILYTIGRNEFMREKRNQWLQICLTNQIQLKMPNIELKTERRCNFIEDATSYICADGQVAPCYRFAHPDIEYVFGRQKQVLPLYFGNVVNESLPDIWNHPEYADLRLQNYSNRFPSCPDCDLVDCCDYIGNSQCDCKGQSPSCGDCLWSRGFVECG